VYWFPPEPIFWVLNEKHTPCCWKLLDCNGLNDHYYNDFTCKATYQIKYSGVELNNCTEYKSAVGL
jgi:hypothetical protein